MVDVYSGKRKWFLLIAIAVLTVVLSFAGFQSSLSSHMYPKDAIQDSSNLSVKGTVTSIKESYKIDGFAMGAYHIFHSYIRLNVTGVLWVGDDLADWITVAYGNNSVTGWSTIGIGYDNLDNPQLVVGQTIECKGYYAAYTDTPYSGIITISPSINASYLKPQAP
jgi:hypothetical protein